jgi:hypothetical protein
MPDQQRAHPQALAIIGLKLRARCSSSCSHESLKACRVGIERVAGAARADRLERGFGGQHAGLDRGVAALDARGVQEARVAADQRAAREHQLGQRIHAAGDDRARAVGQALAALEELADGRMGLVALELFDRATDTGSCRRARRRSRPRPGCFRGDTGTTRHRCRWPAASRRCGSPGPACAWPGRSPRAPSGRCRSFADRARASSSKRAISCLPRWPRAPSANSVYFACSSMPGWKLSVGSPSRPTPMLPVATPLTEPFS